MTPPPDPASVARFRSDCAQGLGRAPVAGELFGLAVSGGPDSMAMLALARAAFPGAILAATVDHGLRPAAAEEAAMVARCCAEIGVPHAVLRPAAPIAGASIQAQARTARYALLFAWAAQTGATALLTAHHADDQAETLLMRAARGSGISGLAAIRECREAGAGEWAGRVLRPLLRWRRSELRAIALATGVPFVDDPSNADDSHDRTRFRRLLETHPWLDVPGLARSARHLAEAEQALAACADLFWVERATAAADGIGIDVAGLPRELRRRLARRAIDRTRETAGIVEPEWHHGINIEPLLEALEAGTGASQAGIMAAAKGSLWTFRPAPPRRSL